MDLRNFNNILNGRNCFSASMKKLNGYTFEKIYINIYFYLYYLLKIYLQ